MAARRRGLTAGRLAGWGRRASPGLPRLPAGPTMALAMVLAVPTARPPAALRGTELDPALTSSRASPSPSPLPLSSPSPTLQSWALYSHECPAGQRRAAHSECLAAVTEAARSAGVEVRGRKNVDDGAAVSVPHGCSYSTVSKMAIFNVNPLGTRGEAYQYVCTAKSHALPQPKSAATSHATAAAQPTSDLERYSPIHQPRDTRGEDAGLAGRQGLA